MKRIAVALTAAVFAGAAAAQPQVEKPPGGRGGGVGFGVTIDLGSLLRGAARLVANQTQEDYVAGEIILAWSTGEAAVDPDALARELGASVRARSALSNLGIEVAVFAVPEGRLEEVLARLRAVPGVVADRHALIYALHGEGRLYAHALIGARTAQTLARPVRIGLIDGELPNELPLAATVVTRRFIDGAPDNGRHAAAVACLIACRASSGDAFSGLIEGAALYGAAVLRGGEQVVRGDTFALVQALDWLLAERSEVINVSLGGAGDAVLALAVRRALARGALLVVAAGNGERGGKPSYPAAYPGVIAVAAVDAESRPWPQGTRGDYITLAAPGVEVWVPVPAGRYVTGTSYAAPFVTAALAARLAAGQPANAAVLCASARDLPPAGRDAQTGCGLLRWPTVAPVGSTGFSVQTVALKKNAADADSRNASAL